MLHERFAELTIGLSNAVHSFTHSHPETEPLLDHVRLWIDTGDLSSPPAQSNGHPQRDVDTWIADLLHSLDTILGVIQDIEKATPTTGAHESEKGWLIRQAAQLNDQNRALRLQHITQSLSSLLD